MATLQPVRGTRDILPGEATRMRRVTEAARAIAGRYGYQEMATPIFEFTEVFQRTLGDTTDVVTKEMYTFDDRNGDSLTLRPEGTAGVARALISGGLSQHLPLRYYYEGPMFRYERPQKGRFRQFHQMGVELLGEAGPEADVEVIAVGAHILDELGIAGDVTLELNSLGDGESRAAYRAVLVAYFSARRGDLSDDSRRRLERNPLRILDSKDAGDRAVVAGAPDFSESFNSASADYFAAVRGGLDELGIGYAVNPRLVRGFDYYCHTAFEFTTERLGSQGAVIAGGRYDGLVVTMGGPATPGTGWASGIERLAMMMDDPPPGARPIAIIPVGEDAAPVARRTANALRRAGFTVRLDLRGNLNKRMKRANTANARAAVLIGSDELAREAATVRDLDSGEQNEAALDCLADTLVKFL